MTPPSANCGVSFIASLTSFAIKAASIPAEIAVPTPGKIDAVPEATSPIAPNQSPFIALSIPKARPATAPRIGTFLTANLPTPFAAILAAFFCNVFFAITLPTFPNALPVTPLARDLPNTLFALILARRIAALGLRNPFAIPLAGPNTSFNLLPGADMADLACFALFSAFVIAFPAFAF